MKKRLDQYTMSQFLDIACGDYTHIDADEETARQIAGSLIEAYNRAADPATARARLLEEEKLVKSDAKIKLYRILLNLIAIGAIDEVRDILNLAGQSRVSKRDNDGMKMKIEQLLRTEEGLRERLEDERRAETPADLSEDDFRASFDMQTARLMAHFKFAINHDTVTASVYANLVNMALRQQRQKATK